MKSNAREIPLLILTPAGSVKTCMGCADTLEIDGKATKAHFQAIANQPDIPSGRVCQNCKDSMRIFRNTNTFQFQPIAKIVEDIML